MGDGFDGILLGSVPGRSRACAALITKVAETLGGRSEELARQLTDRVVREIEVVGGDEDLVAGVLETARGSVVLVTAMARSWTDPSVVPPPQGAMDWARGLVDRRLPLEVILRAYRLGQAAYADAWYHELVGTGAEPLVVAEAMHACSAFLFVWVDAISDSLVLLHARETERRLRGVEALRVETVRRVLDDEALDVEQASVRLGYRLAGTHRAFVVWSESDGDEEQGALLEGTGLAVSESFAGQGAPGLVVGLWPRLVAGWTAVDPRDERVLPRLTDSQRRARCRIAFGDVGADMDGFRTSHDQAMRARRVARLLRTRDDVTVFGDVAVADLLTRDVPAARAFARATLGPLATSDEGARRLLATLKVYFEEGHSVARTGRRLSLSPNTVSYRVRRAVELAGERDAWSPDLQAAVVLAPLVGGDVPDPAE